MKKPLVSIVMSIYDTEKFLDQTLTSIQNQTMGDFECLMVEDGSPDRCGEIIDGWAAKDPRFKAFHKENGGVVSGWRMGIQNAAGRWLVIVDSDDGLVPWALEAELDTQKQHPESMVVWQWSSDREELKTRPEQMPVTRRGTDELGRMYLESMLYYTWGRLFDLDVIRAAGLLPPLGLIYGSDLIFCVDYMQAALASGQYRDFAQIDAPLYFYRTDNATSLTTRLRPSYCDDELKTCRYLMDLSAARPEVPAADLDRVLLHRLRTLAEGIGYVLGGESGFSPEESRRRAEGYLNNATMQELMRQCRARKLYSPYLAPLCRGRLEQVCQLWQLKENDLRQYQRRYWAGYWLHFLRTGRRDAPMF